jgi:multiple sugar transport system substrate-binding protein
MMNGTPQRLQACYFLLFVSLVLGACGHPSQTQSLSAANAIPTAVTSVPTTPEPVVIDVWFHAGASLQREVMRQGLETFNATRDDIQVELVELPEGDYDEQVQAAAYGAAIAGELPCLLDFDGPNTYNYVWQGFLVPLDKYVSTEMRADFLPSIIQQGTYQDGRLYSLGQYDSGLAIWGNRRYLEQAGLRAPTVDNPWNRQEFEDALAALQALPEVAYALDLKMNYDVGEFYTYAFSPILQSFGADLIDRDTYQRAEGALNGPEAVAAMEMVQDWFEQGYVNPDPADDTDFVEGRAALSWVGHWAFTPYREALGDNLVLLPMPDFGNGPKTGMGSWNWGITTNCQHQDEAWQVLDFILQPELILRQTEAAGTIPARKSALARADLYRPGGLLHLYLQQNEAGYTVPRPITPAYPTISRIFATVFVNIARGAEVQAELDWAVGQIEQHIEANDGY